MELLNKINAFSSLSTFKNMSELNIDEKYPVMEIKQITTKYGKKVVVELEDGFSICLPQRFDEKASEYLKLNDIGSLFFVYLGMKDVGKPQPAHMFKFEQASDI